MKDFVILERPNLPRFSSEYVVGECTTPSMIDRFWVAHELVKRSGFLTLRIKNPERGKSPGVCNHGRNFLRFFGINICADFSANANQPLEFWWNSAPKAL
jgi:hypothetical protein